MRGPWIVAGLLLALALSAPAGGASVMFEISDQDGRPVTDAVIALGATAGAPVELGAAPQIIVDQRNETFIPLVSVLLRGGAAIFSNSDRVRHHVYSFSPIKQFQLILNPGESSAPVKFDKTGVAAIGCNIHDKMVTYIYVTETKWTALTRSDGSGVFQAVPRGEYTATIWHPQLKPGAAEPTVAVSVGAQPLNLPVSIMLSAKPAMSGHHGNGY